MARSARPSGRFFIYSALTALAVVFAYDRVSNKGGVSAPAGRTVRRVPG